MFVCQFLRLKYDRLPFNAAPAGDMFQWKIDEIFKGVPNIFGIADDICIVGYDKLSWPWYHDRTGHAAGKISN